MPDNIHPYMPILYLLLVISILDNTLTAQSARSPLPSISVSTI
jgi:hypothetical protein